MLALLACLTLAPAARAYEGDADTTEDGWKKVFAYARCAFEIWKAVTPAEWGAAFFDCGRTIMDEPAPGAQP
jgi:hypothetical protein